MLLEREQLEGMKMNDLKHLALEVGIDPSLPSETKDVLINRLLIHSAKEPLPDTIDQNAKEMASTDAKDGKPVGCSIQEVKTAVAPFIFRGMKLYHDAETSSWMMRVQLKSMVVRDSRTGESKMIERWRDDSGTLKQPIEVIKRCARILMQGAPTPEQIKPQFDPADHYEAIA